VEADAVQIHVVAGPGWDQSAAPAHSRSLPAGVAKSGNTVAIHVAIYKIRSTVYHVVRMIPPPWWIDDRCCPVQPTNAGWTQGSGRQHDVRSLVEIILQQLLTCRPRHARVANRNRVRSVLRRRHLTVPRRGRDVLLVGTPTPDTLAVHERSEGHRSSPSVS